MKCIGCGVEGCSIQDLHERVAESSFRVQEKMQTRREVLFRHGIEFPASFGMGERDDIVIDKIVNTILNLEKEVESLRAA